MMRKRSYVEAMEDGSFHDLLEGRSSNNHQNTSGIVISVDKMENNTSDDESAFDRKDDFRSKSQDFDMCSSSDRNTVISITRDFVSENDVNVDISTLPIGAIVDYKKDSNISENSDASRGLSIVDELINEPLIDDLYKSISKKSLQDIEQINNNNTWIDKERRESIGNEINEYDRIDVENGGTENIGQFQQTDDDHYAEEEPPFYDRETNYDSDDMTLDFEEREGERHERINSLTIPNDVASGDNSVLPIEYIGRNSIRKQRRRPENGGNRSRRVKRLVFRNGDTNIPLRHNIPGKMGKFMTDIVTTLIECQWRWITLIFSLGHFLLWLIFALMFYVASYSNGDMSDDPPGRPCIENGRTFTGIFGFSVESQVSIGYGEKSPTEECPEVIFILVMEVIAGYALLGALVGIVYAKIVRPEKKIEGVGFSKHAVICMRDGQLCLVVRLWDTMGKHVIGTRVSAYLINHNVPNSIPLVLEQPNPVIMWPTTVQHNIVEGSPLYDTSAKDLLDQKFEIVFSITGSSRTTGQMAQTRTSYLPQNILWGQRFQNAFSYDKNCGSYTVDHKSLNTVKEVETPLCSARLLDQITEQGPSSPFFISTPSSPSTLNSPEWSFKREYKPHVARRLANN